MKKIILLIAILFIITATSQVIVEADLLQDFRMSFENKAYEDLYGGINDYRNFTLNTYVKVKIKDNPEPYLFRRQPLLFYIGIGWEYAQLVKEYHRANVEMGAFYDFTEWFEGSIGINTGMIFHNSETLYPSFGGDIELAFIIHERFKLITLSQIVERPNIKYSQFIGIGYKF